MTKLKTYLIVFIFKERMNKFLSACLDYQMFLFNDTFLTISQEFIQAFRFRQLNVRMRGDGKHFIYMFLKSHSVL